MKAKRNIDNKQKQVLDELGSMNVDTNFQGLFDSQITVYSQDSDFTYTIELPSEILRQEKTMLENFKTMTNFSSSDTAQYKQKMTPDELQKSILNVIKKGVIFFMI